MRDDEHTVQETQSLEQLMSERVCPELHVLGNFAVNYILNNQKIILNAKMVDGKLIASEILVEL